MSLNRAWLDKARLSWVAAGWGRVSCIPPLFRLIRLHPPSAVWRGIIKTRSNNLSLVRLWIIHKRMGMHFVLWLCVNTASFCLSHTQTHTSRSRLPLVYGFRSLTNLVFFWLWRHQLSPGYMSIPVNFTPLTGRGFVFLNIHWPENTASCSVSRSHNQAKEDWKGQSVGQDPGWIMTWGSWGNIICFHSRKNISLLLLLSWDSTVPLLLCFWCGSMQSIRIRSFLNSQSCRDIIRTSQDLGLCCIFLMFIKDSYCIF